MPTLTEEDFLQIAEQHGPGGPKPRKPRAAGLDLSKAGPVSVPAGIPQLPPVTPVQTTPKRGQNPDTVAAIDGLLNEQQPGTVARPATPRPAAPPAAPASLSEDDFRQIAAQHGPEAATARPANPRPVASRAGDAAVSISPVPAYRNARAQLTRPDVAGAYTQLAATAKQRFGWTVDLRSGDRDGKQQASLYYAPGNVQVGPHTRRQAKNGLLVAEPGFSKHEEGAAIDVVVRDSRGRLVPQSKLAALAKEHGFEWLGVKDPPHFTYRGKQAGGFDYQPAPTPRIPSAAELLGPELLGPEPPRSGGALPRPAARVSLTEDDFRAIAKQHGPEVNPATAAMARGELYGPPKEQMGPPRPGSQPIPRERIEGGGKFLVFDPFTGREIRKRNLLERAGFDAQGFVVGNPGGKTVAARRGDQAQGRETLDPVFSSDPQVRQKQQAEADQVNNYLRDYLARRQRAVYQQPDAFKESGKDASAHYATTLKPENLLADMKAHGFQPTPWQKAVAQSLLSAQRYRLAHSGKEIQDAAVVGGINAAAGALGGVLAKGAAGLAGRFAPGAVEAAGNLVARAGRAAPIIERGVESAAHGGSFGMLQAPAIRKYEDPKASLGDLAMSSLEGGGAGLALGFGLGAGGASVKALRQLLRDRRLTTENAARSVARQYVEQRRATGPRSATGPEPLLAVDRHPKTGKFVPAGQGTPAARVPTLDTPAGPVRLTPGMEVAAPSFSRATFKVKQVLPGNRVSLESTVNGTKLETTLDRIAPPEAVRPSAAPGPLDAAPSAPAGAPAAPAAPEGAPVDPRWAAVERGEVELNGRQSAVLQVAKKARDAGHLNTPEEFADLAGRVEAIQRQGLKGKPYQDALRRTLTDWSGEREAAAAAARRETGDFTTKGEAAFGEASLTQDGRIRRSAVEHPLTAEETEDLVLARRFRENPEDPEALDWMLSAPDGRTSAAFNSLENPSVRRAVEALEARRLADQERGARGVQQELEAQGLRGRPLVQEVHHYGDRMAWKDPDTGTTHRYRYITEEHQRPEVLEELYRVLATPGRVNREFQTSAGRMSLRDLIFDGKMIPEDAAAAGGGLRAQAAQAEVRGARTPTAATADIPSQLEPATAAPAPGGRRVTLEVEGQQRTADLTPEQAQRWDALEAQVTASKDRVKAAKARRDATTYNTSARGQAEIALSQANGDARATGFRVAAEKRELLGLRTAKEQARTSAAPSRLQEATAERQAAQAELDAALQAATKKHGGKLLSGGLAPDPEAVRDFLPVMRALVKLGYTGAKELEAAFLERVTNASHKFAVAVREALEREDGPLGAAEGSGAASKVTHPNEGPTTPRSPESSGATTARSLPEAGQAVTPRPAAKVEPLGTPRPVGAAPRERVGVMNLTKFTGEEARAAIWKAVQENEGRVAEQRRGVRTHAETRAAAEALGITLEDLQRIKPGTAANAETLEVVGGLVQHLSDEVRAAARTYEAVPTEENWLRLEAARQEQILAVATFKGMEAEWGRAGSQLGRLRQALQPKVKPLAEAVDEIHLEEHAPADVPPVETARRLLPQFAEEPAAKVPTPAAPEGKPIPRLTRLSPEAEARLRAKAEQRSLPGVELERAAERPLSRLSAEAEARLRSEAMQQALEGVDAPQVAGQAARRRRGGRVAGPRKAFGADNQVYTSERLEAALSRLAKNALKPKITLKGSPDPLFIAADVAAQYVKQNLPDLIEVGGFVVEGGARSFQAWAKGVRTLIGQELPDAQLRPVWDALRPETTRRVRQAVQRDQAISRLMETVGKTPEERLADAREIASLKDPVAVAKWVLARNKVTAEEKFFHLWRVGLTMGPNTHLKNLVSNAISVGSKTPVDLLSAAANLPARALYKALGKELGDPLTARDAIAGAVASFQHGLPAGVKRAAEVMRHNFTEEQARTLDFHGGYEAPGGLANPYVLSPRLQAATDQFFRGYVFEGERAALALRKAMSEGRRGPHLQARVAELMEDPAILDRAEETAAYYTFNSDPVEFVRRFLRLRNTPGAGGAVLKFVSPFVSITANVLRKGFNESPLGLVRLLGREAKTAEQASRIIGEAAFGTAVWSTLFHVVRNGDITGEAPTDPRARAAFYADKRQPYSIKVGGHWWRYSGLGGMTSILATVAATKSEFWEKGEATPLDRFWRVTQAAIASTKEQSFLSGIFDLGDLADTKLNAEGVRKAVGRYVGSQATGFLPLSGLLRSVARATDDTQRVTAGPLEQVRANVPGLSRSLPPRLDPLGREVKREPGGLWQAQPFLAGRADADPLVRELVRLKVYPSPIDRNLTAGGRKVTLTDAQHQAAQKAIGQAQEARARQVFGSAYYRQYRSDEQRAKALRGEIGKARRAATEEYLGSLGVEVPTRRRGIRMNF